MSVEQRRGLIDPEYTQLPIVRQCALVSISRSSFYHRLTAETAETLALMRLIDAQFLETPRYGSRQMARQLRRDEALREASARFGRPEIFNTDQGSQFTSTDFTDVLRGARVHILTTTRTKLNSAAKLSNRAGPSQLAIDVVAPMVLSSE